MSTVQAPPKTDTDELRDCWTFGPEAEPMCHAAADEIEWLREKGSPGVMHEVDAAFYRLTVQQRDAAWRESERKSLEIMELRAEIHELRQQQPPTVYECIAHIQAGGIVEEQTKGWRHSGNGGQWVEATFSLADYEEWVRKDVPRGFLRLRPIDPGKQIEPEEALGYDEARSLLVKIMLAAPDLRWRVARELGVYPEFPAAKALDVDQQIITNAHESGLLRALAEGVDRGGDDDQS